MHREFCCNLTCPLAIGGFCALPNPLVEVRPSPQRYPLVHHFLIQCVQKAIAGSNGSIWPCRCAFGLEELPTPSEYTTALLHCPHCGLSARCHCGSRELHTRNASGFEQMLIFSTPPLQLLLNHLPNRRRSLQFHGSAIDFVVRHQFIHHIDHEQGVSLGALVNGVG